MARRQGEETVQDTGVTAYHEADEPLSGRCVVLGNNPPINHGQARIKITEPFWADRSEELTYMAAVEANPQEPDESSYAYVMRLSAYVAKRYESIGESMPKPMTRKQRDEELRKLRIQAARAVTGEREDD